MKTAVNGTLWGSYAQYHQTKMHPDDFLRDAAEAGYDGVEIGGGEKMWGTPRECLKKVKSYGLEICAYSASVTYNPWPPNTKDYRESIRYGARLGVKTLMVCGGFIPSPRRNTYPWDYDIFAGNLGAMMAYAGTHDMTVAFHPHRGCIVETATETLEMVTRLPEMRLCPDFAHLEAAGDDALAFIRTYGVRCIHTHVKDYHWGMDSFTELGKGKSKLNVADCVAALRESGYDGWWCVEMDRKWPAGSTPPTPLESARVSRQYLQKKCGV